jgi:hypothetical protein
LAGLILWSRVSGDPLAGPCGTVVDIGPHETSGIAWSVQELFLPLFDYYAGRPRHAWHAIGPKHGGGNGRGMLCR